MPIASGPPRTWMVNSLPAGVVRLLHELEEAARVDERRRKDVRRADGVGGEGRRSQNAGERGANSSEHLCPSRCLNLSGHLTIGE